PGESSGRLPNSMNSARLLRRIASRGVSVVSWTSSSSRKGAMSERCLLSDDVHRGKHGAEDETDVGATVRVAGVALGGQGAEHLPGEGVGDDRERSFAGQRNGGSDLLGGQREVAE